MSLVKMACLTLVKMFKPEIIKATIALTWRCNHKCLTCGIWHENDHSNELSTDEVKKLINRNKLLWFAITGGEAFLRSDIADILRMATLKYPSVSVTTNGSQPKKIEQSISYALKDTKGLLAVNLSLDGDKEQHDTFAGCEGSFDRVIETIDRLKALRNPRLKLTIENLVSLVTHEGYDFVKRYAKSKNASLAYTIEMRSEAFYRNENIPYKGNSIPEASFDIKNPFNYLYIRQAKRNKPVRCVAGEYDCVVTPEGTVKPCWFLDDEAYNIKNTDYKIVPLGNVSREAVEYCNSQGGCWTPCSAYLTMMMRPWRVL